MITGANESIKLTKHLSCECKCRFDWKKCNPNQYWNNKQHVDVSVKKSCM